jgi:hypothetical protein
MEAQLAFANGLFAAGDRDAAADKLLAMVAADRTWNEGAARARLLQIFEAIGLEDPWWRAPAASCRPCCSADAHERGGRQDQAFDLPAVRGAAVPGLQLPLHFRAALSGDGADARPRPAHRDDPHPAEGAAVRGCVWARSRMSRRWKTGFQHPAGGRGALRWRELDVSTPFRQIEAQLLPDDPDEVLSAVERAGSGAARTFADAQAIRWIGIRWRGSTINR